MTSSNAKNKKRNIISSFLAFPEDFFKRTGVKERGIGIGIFLLLVLVFNLILHTVSPYPSYSYWGIVLTSIILVPLVVGLGCLVFTLILKALGSKSGLKDIISGYFLLGLFLITFGTIFNFVNTLFFTPLLGYLIMFLSLLILIHFIRGLKALYKTDYYRVLTAFIILIPYLLVFLLMLIFTTRSAGL